MRGWIKGAAVLAVAAIGLLGGSAPVKAADDPAYLVMGAGTWETLRNPKGELDLDYRSSYKLWIFKPHFGALVAAAMAVLKPHGV